MRVLVLNGPNLNLLGAREPEIYGRTTLADLERLIRSWGAALGIDIDFFQSNHEGALVEAIQEAAGSDGLVINAGALTHTSRSIGDAIQSVGITAVEVHISDIKRREPWRAHSLVSPTCVRTIHGRGIGGYQDALRHLRNRSEMGFDTVRYGPHAENVGDLRRPIGDAAGMVVLVHGGLWRREHERDTTETLAVDLAKRGYITWNVEYRRTGDGGGWPGSPHDVLTAFDFVRRLDTTSGLPVALVGHSAGGHLAIWTGSHRAEGIALIVGLAPVTDLSAMARSGAIGADDARALLDSGAPTRLDLLPGRTVLVHGDLDEIVPVSQSTGLATAARVEVIPGMGHFPLLDPSREHWPLIVGELERAMV